MRLIAILVVSVLTALTMTGCGEEPPEQTSQGSGEHIWKNQTRALESARNVAKDVEREQAAMDDRIRRATGD